MLVSETSASVAPKIRTACSCYGVAIFLATSISVDQQSFRIVAFPSGPFLGGSNFDPRCKKSVIQVPCRNPCFFKVVTLVRKSDHLPPPSKKKPCTSPAIFAAQPQCFFAAKASDVPLARRFAFRFDARAPKWDLNVSRTNGKVNFSFLLLFDLGG